MKIEKNYRGRNEYLRKSYLTIDRWTTYAELVKCVLRIKPFKIMEIGIGNRLVSDILEKIGFSIKVLDIDKSLQPDYVMDIRDDAILQFKNEFDLIIVSQVLEHIKYSEFLKVINNLNKITKKLILTLPYTNYNSYFLGIKINFHIKRHRSIQLGYKFFQKKIHHRTDHPRYTLDNVHHWEIGKEGFSIRKIRKDIRNSGWIIERNFYNHDNPIHYFFILRSIDSS